MAQRNFPESAISTFSPDVEDDSVAATISRPAASMSEAVSATGRATMNSFEHHAGRIAAILLCTTSAAAFAQPASTQPQAAEEAGTGFEEIVVTARRRAENIQNVPTTIQAI